MEIPGIHGKCHQNCYSKHGDLRIVVNGGWHDAGDLTATGHIPGISYSLFAFPELAARSLEIAREDWDYGVKGLETAAPFTPVYGAVDELERTSIGLLATVDLYQATGDRRYA